MLSIWYSMNVNTASHGHAVSVTPSLPAAGRLRVPQLDRLDHRKIPQTPPRAARPFRLLPYQHTASVSPLECAVTRSPTTAHSKQLTGSANSFRMRSYAKTGGRGCRPFAPSHLPFTPKDTRRKAMRQLRSYPRNLRPPRFRILFQVPYPLNCFLSRSSKNCRRIPTIFPMWNSPNLCVLCVSTLSFSRRGTSVPLAALGLQSLAPIHLITRALTPAKSTCIPARGQLTLQVGNESGRSGLGTRAPGKLL